MFELTEDFIKMLQTAFLIIGTLSIFLIFISYDIDVFNDESRREALLMVEALLTDNCLTVNKNNKPVKALFSAEKLDEVVSDPICLSYDYGIIEVELLDGSRESWVIDLGISNKDIKTEPFNIAIDLGDDGVKPGKIVVSI